jgi:hypothetical protein
MLFCSVIAQNFLPHARVLAESLAQHHPGCAVDVLIVDAPDAPAEVGEPFRRVSLGELPLPAEEINRRRTLYDIAGLASSLRGALLERCLARTGDPVCYLDADMLVLAPLDDIAPLVARHGIVLTRTRPCRYRSDDHVSHVVPSSYTPRCCTCCPCAS